MMDSQAYFGPDQQEVVKRWSACSDFMVEVAKRGDGIHVWDANMFATLVTVFYKSLPIDNAKDRVGEIMEQQREDYLRRMNDLDNDPKLSREEYALKAWKLTSAFMDACRTFMYDTMFATDQRKKKQPTEGIGYKSIG